MEKPKLYMVMLGCKPKGRLTEQHDVFFGIGKSLKDLVPQIKNFWPEANGVLHIDAWREITTVDGYGIEVVTTEAPNSESLFFINLGGYKPGEFDEYHYKLLTVATELSEAVRKSKSTAFYKHYGFVGAVSHVDDKFGIDVDDIYNVQELLPIFQDTYNLEITPGMDRAEDKLHIGYLKISKLLKDGSE